MYLLFLASWIAAFALLAQYAEALQSSHVLPRLEDVELFVNFTWQGTTKLETKVSFLGQNRGPRCWPPQADYIDHSGWRDDYESAVIRLGDAKRDGRLPRYFHVNLFAVWWGTEKQAGPAKPRRATVAVAVRRRGGGIIVGKTLEISPTWCECCPRTRVASLSFISRPRDATLSISNYHDRSCQLDRAPLPYPVSVPGVRHRFLQFDPPSVVEQASVLVKATYNTDNLPAHSRKYTSFVLYREDRPGALVRVATLHRDGNIPTMFRGFFNSVHGLAPGQVNYRAVPRIGITELHQSPAVKTSFMTYMPRLWGVGFGAELSGFGEKHMNTTEDNNITEIFDIRLTARGAKSLFSVSVTFNGFTWSSKDTCTSDRREPYVIGNVKNETLGAQEIEVIVLVGRAFRDTRHHIFSINVATNWDDPDAVPPGSKIEGRVLSSIITDIKRNGIGPNRNQRSSSPMLMMMEPGREKGCPSTRVLKVCTADILESGKWQFRVLYRQDNGMLG